MRPDLAAFVLRARYERASDRRCINTTGTLPIGQVHLETQVSRVEISPRRSTRRELGAN
jgi:hypothetical protein